MLLLLVASAALTVSGVWFVAGAVAHWLDRARRCRDRRQSQARRDAALWDADEKIARAELIAILLRRNQ